MAMVVARGGAKKSTTPLCPRQACHPRWAAPAPRTVLRACCTVRGYRHLQLARNGGSGLHRRRLCWRPPAGTAAAAAAAAAAALGGAFFAPNSALWVTGRALARCEGKEEDCGEGTSESAEKVEPPAPGSEDEARMVAEIPEAHLLEYIASVERPMLGEPRSSLMHMAETGRAVLAARLLSLGANPNLRDARGRSPLHVAAWKGHAAVVEELLRAGAAVEGKDRKYGGTPLTLAAMHGQVDVVRLLLEKGADRDATLNPPPQSRFATMGSGEGGAMVMEAQGMNALHLAAWEGHGAVVDVLLAAGAAADTLSGHLQTAQALAAERGHSSIARNLGRAAASGEQRGRHMAIVDGAGTEGPLLVCGLAVAAILARHCAVGK